MPSRPLTGLYDPPPRAAVIDDLAARARARLGALSPAARQRNLENTVYEERHRLERAHGKGDEVARVERLAQALVHNADPIAPAVDLVRAWGEEIHGNFSWPAFRFATTVFPPALGALLNGRPASGLADWNPDPQRRITVDGPLPLLRELADEAVLLLTPTHVSNLDSGIIGLALALSGLPPFQYGAGLNLFSNPVVGWWLRRLGAYTVDRTKRAELYKSALKDYSVRQLKSRTHGLFFPGGTRSRSGAIEAQVKKGLLGTGLAAWQEMITDQRPDRDVYVVPLTLSFQLGLEANTLIDDHLAEAGKQRYIISDDEFAQPRQLATFFSRVLSLDSAIVLRFGHPVDVLGNPVPTDRQERAAASERRLGYVCKPHTAIVEPDEQRDHLYTERLASTLCRTWPTLATVMTTHLTAWVAWRELERTLGTTDPFRIVRTPVGLRRIPLDRLRERLGAAVARAHAQAAAGSYYVQLPATGDAVLSAAIDTFARYHRSRAIAVDGGDLVVEDPRLCLYYRNRATFAGLEAS
jgi:glycerol-3-phosphate O-acyltransferase